MIRASHVFIDHSFRQLTKAQEMIHSLYNEFNVHKAPSVLWNYTLCPHTDGLSSSHTPAHSLYLHFAPLLFELNCILLKTERVSARFVLNVGFCGDCSDIREYIYFIKIYCCMTSTHSTHTLWYTKILQASYKHTNKQANKLPILASRWNGRRGWGGWETPQFCHV